MAFMAILIYINGYGQGGDPCSINAGADQVICHTDQNFSLNGIIGNNVDPNSIGWISFSPSFQIVSPGSLSTGVTVNNPTPGTYTFQLSANCIDGNGNTTPIFAQMQVVVKDDVTPAAISVNGDNQSGYTFCHTATAVGNSNLLADESGSWKIISKSPLISVDFGSNPSTVDLNYPNRREDVCPSITLCYEVTNGGCFSRDTVVITFVGQQNNVQALDMSRIEYGKEKRINLRTTGFIPAVCFNTVGHSFECDSIIHYENLDSNLTISGTNIGCDGSFDYTLLNPQDFNQLPQTVNKYASEIRTYEELKFFESGCYEYEYSVTSPNGYCDSGKDTFRVFIHLDTVTLFDEDLDEMFCESFPDTFWFDHQVQLGYPNYDQWFVFVDMGVKPIVVCNSVDPSLQRCFITDIDAQTTWIGIEQSYKIIGCDGELAPCDRRSITLEIGPSIDEETIEISSSCGAINNFNPWDLVTLRGSGRPPVHRTKILNAPPNNSSTPLGLQPLGTNNFYDLQEVGQYVFEITVAKEIDVDFCTSKQCSDTALVIVDICEEELPSAPQAADLCVNDTVLLVGSIPVSSCSEPLWTQLSGPTIQFVNGSTAQDAQPEISVAQTGIVCLEYSYSQSQDCYLADTTCFNIIECEAPCISAEIVNVYCNNQNTSDPNDDFWYFDLLITDNSGQGYYWTTSGDITESGSYGNIKTIYTSGTILTTPSVSFRVFDAQNPECFVDLVVTAPTTCSEDCDMTVDPPIIQCIDIEGQKFYTVNLTVTVPGNECYFVKRKNPDGSEVILGTYTGSQTISYGPYTPGEEFTIWVMLCDNFSCVIDFYVRAPEDCGYCLDYEVTNISCYDSNTSDPDDDYWSFDLIATGGPGTYWTATSPINQSSAYGLYKTIWRGTINQNPVADFEIYDNVDTECNAFVKVDAPPTCSAECDLMIFPSISQCDTLEGEEVFNIFLDVQTTLEDCYTVSKKNLDGTEEDLGTFSASQVQLLGPFDASEGFTLWVMLCEYSNCVADAFISAPDCSGGDQEPLSTDDLSNLDIDIRPIPATSEIFIDMGENSQTVYYDIYSISGQRLQSGRLNNSTERVGIEQLSVGVYYIKFQDGKSTLPVLKFEKIE